MKIHIAILILGCCSFGTALPQTYEQKGSKVFRIVDAGKVENGLAKLRDLQENKMYDFWTEPSTKVATDVLVPETRLEEFEEYMKNEGFTYSVMIEDLGKLILAEKMANKQGKAMDWENYQRYETIVDFVTQSALAHNDIASIEEMGKTTENRSIIVVKIGRPSENKTKPAVFMDGGIHAREWISPALTTYFINQLLNNFTFHEDILSEVDLYIVPVLNPDGYEFTHTNNRMWRKNRRPDSSCAGVDLNRNYGFHWGDIGSSGNKCSEIYRGTSAFSEPESQAMKSYIDRKREEGVNWRAYFAIHSYAQMWLLPWGWTYDFPEDYDDLAMFGNIGLDALTPVHGTPYKIGTITEILSPGSGGSDDWAKGSEIFKYVQTVEVRDTGRYGFLLPPDQIKDCAEETWAAITATSRFLATEQTSSSVV